MLTIKLCIIIYRITVYYNIVYIYVYEYGLNTFEILRGQSDTCDNAKNNKNCVIQKMYILSLQLSKIGIHK